MNSDEKRKLTSIKEIPQFKRIMEKLTTDVKLEGSEAVYILSCAIIFLKYYEKDNRLTSYVEFSYYIVLKYSTFYNDYQALYDFSTDLGYYPISKAILDNGLIADQSILDLFLDIELDRFRNELYIETLHQYNEKRHLLEEEAMK